MNAIIDEFNNWQLKHDFCFTKKRALLAHIEFGKQVIADDNEWYLETLNKMEEFVNTTEH